ncbi:MAG TPA: glycosyltransferase family 87 protein [Solirubrobacteraceae bacterium]|nr:glycosyltransferase family 87 protein [Solirubrobacteraceae bacterium]
MAIAAAPERRPRVSEDHGYSVGTRLEEEPLETVVPAPGRLYGLAVFAIAALFFGIVGYQVTIGQHVIVFDALDRLARAYLIWHNEPPKLAAIGFAYPPLTTFVFLPLAGLKPLATTLIALPLSTALFGGAAMVMLDRVLARCDMVALLRIPLLVVFAINPLFLFYAGNGMSEVVYLALEAFSLYCFVSWYESTEPRYLIGAGFGMAVMLLTRYAFIIWAALFAVLIGVALVRRRASRMEVEGSVVAYAAPVIYALALWILFNALIIADPFGWLTSSAVSTQAVNATGIVGHHALAFSEISRRLLDLNVAVFPLAFLVVPALVLTFVSQRNDLALWLASFVVLGIVIIGVHAYAAENEGLLTLRDSMPMMVASFVGAGWVYRSFPAARLGIWLVTLALLIISLFTAWDGMQNYPFQSEEQAFTRAIQTGQDQTGMASRGGYRVGIAAEAQMATFINDHVTRHKAVLADNAQSFGVILLSGRPQLILTRADRGDTAWTRVMLAPWGKVDYVLVAFNPSSGDLIQHHYGTRLNQGQVPGLSVVLRNDRYILLRVAGRNPGARQAPRTPSATSNTSTPATGTPAPAGTPTGASGPATVPANTPTSASPSSSPGTGGSSGVATATTPTTGARAPKRSGATTAP